MNRAEHLAWCKKRAMDLIDQGQIGEAFVSMVSDLGKHEETANHIAIEIGTLLLLGGQLDTPEEMRRFIDGFN